MRALWLIAPMLAPALLVLVLVSPGEAHADMSVPADWQIAQACSPRAASCAAENVFVSPNWQLTPNGLGEGDRFRLLFVTDSQTDLLPAQFSFQFFDDYVQNAISDGGHDAVRPYASVFQAVVSCGAASAVTHTGTQYHVRDRDVPIYWLGGDKVADNYADFWGQDVSGWSSNDPQNERGEDVDNLVWTGTNRNGTSGGISPDAAGFLQSTATTVCNNPSTIGKPSEHGKEIEYFGSTWDYSRSMYGLSAVLTVSITPSSPEAPTVSQISSNSALVQWRAPAFAGATPIHDYDVDVRQVGGLWEESIPAVRGTDTSVILTNLSSDTEYEVRVRANNHGTDRDGAVSSIVLGSWSPSASFRTSQPATPQDQLMVATDWELIPDGLDAGDRFRLLFVTSNVRNDFFSTLQSYNNFVAGAAVMGHEAIRPFNDDFRAVASDVRASAQTNTDTHYSSGAMGVPIYWLDGDKVADDYADFWDGCWDSNRPQNEYGESEQARSVWTGTDSDGEIAVTTFGLFSNDITIGNPSSQCNEVDSDVALFYTSHSVYGLSPVLTVR